MPAIDVEDLTVRFGTTLAVDRVTFSAHAGEILCLLGPNGAGKTTTVETVEGYRRPTGGTVRVLGLDPVADRLALTARLGVMLQGGGTYPQMTPERALRLFASYYDAPVPRPSCSACSASTTWRAPPPSASPAASASASPSPSPSWGDPR